MQTTLLKEYVSKAKDLELSCYEQKLLCDDLEQTLVNVDYQRKNKEDKKKKFEEFSWSTFIVNCICSGIMWIIVGIVFFGLIGIVTYFITGLGIIMHFNIPIIGKYALAYWNTLGISGIFKYIKNFLLIGCAIGILFLLSEINTDYSKKSIKKRNKKIDEFNADVQNEVMVYNSKYEIISQNLEHAKMIYQNTLKTKEDFYSLNIIYPKYRDLVSVGMFNEYLQSGRCYTLEGHEGAYNLYEEEKFKEIILTKLDDIISRLDTIIANQEELANEIIRSRNEANRIATTIENSLQNIENNEIARRYYEEITARNTSYLAWTAYKFNYKI